MATNKELFEQAQKYMPGGVNSPVRAFKAVGGTPKFIKRAKGPYIYDEEGKEYIDYCCSWGPMILGHAHDEVLKVLNSVMKDGTSFGAPNKWEIELAKLICESVPSIEKVRMVNSGTEAVMSAVRLARAFTKRDSVLKFTGNYHGHLDAFLVQAGSGLATLGAPSSPGVSQDMVKKTLLCEYNDIEGVKKIFEQKGNEIAAVIVEPIAANMAMIKPAEGFLETLGDISKKYGTLLIYDEVITGFRVSPGGYQGAFPDVKPDITVLGKIIGGGLPVGAYGGRTDIMSMVSPSGDVYQAGTLSGNPLAMAAGATTLKKLISENPYDDLRKKTQRLVSQFYSKEDNYALSAHFISSMFCLFFNDEIPTNWNKMKACDGDKYALFFNKLLEKGIYFPPSQFETCFVSTAHTDKEINYTVKAVKESLKEVFK